MRIVYKNNDEADLKKVFDLLSVTKTKEETIKLMEDNEIVKQKADEWTKKEVDETNKRVK
jgi:hypothetical protein